MGIKLAWPCGVLLKHLPFPQVISELEGKDINEVISEGMSKLASMPAGTLDVHVFLVFP